jgi:outer membrane protein
MKRHILGVLLGLALSPALHGADLMEVYREALTQDPQLAAARDQYQAAQERVPQARAGLLPLVNLTANANRLDVYNQASGHDSSNGYAVSASQPLFRMQNYAAYEQSKSALDQAEAVFQASTQDLILRVSTAYFDVLLAEYTLRLAEALKTAFAEQLEQAKRSFEVGTATIVDTHEAQARHDLATSQVIAAENDLEFKKRALQAITGRAYESLKSFAEKVPLVAPDPNSMDFWVDKAENSSLAVVAQQQGLEIARLEVDRNKAGHYPTLDLVASYSDQPIATQLSVGPNVRSTTVGVQFALPIFQGLGQQARVREAVALQDRARNDLETAKRNAALAAKQAYLGVTSGIAQSRALEQALVSSKSQLDSTILGRDVGVRTSVDVLNAEQQLFSTRRDLAQAYYNYLLFHLRLKAAVGTLAEEDVARINAALK